MIIKLIEELLVALMIMKTLSESDPNNAGIQKKEHEKVPLLDVCSLIQVRSLLMRI